MHAILLAGLNSENIYWLLIHLTRTGCIPLRVNLSVQPQSATKARNGKGELASKGGSLKNIFWNIWLIEKDTYFWVVIKFFKICRSSNLPLPDSFWCFTFRFSPDTISPWSA